MFPWIAFPLLFILILLKIPIGFAMGIVSLLALLDGGYRLAIIPVILADSLTSFVLLAIPMFILVGELLARGKIANVLVDAASSMVGFIRGGLSLVNILTSMLFAKFSGSSVADAAAIGGILIPEMVRKGYPRGFSVAVTSASASIGIIIPPSIAMLIYAFSADVSVARMFLGGVVPGLIFGFVLMVIAYIISRKNDWPIYEPFVVKNVLNKSKRAVPGLVVPITIFGGILIGAFTVTESAAIAVFLSILLGLFVYKGLKFRDIPDLMLKSAKTTASVLMIISTSTVFSWYLTAQGVPTQLARALLNITENPDMLLFIILWFVVISGIIIHANPMIIMYTPIFLPLMMRVGMDPIHFGVTLIMAICVGQQTPPVASVLLTACSVGKYPVSKIHKDLWPFFLALFFVMFLIAYVPALSLWLPNLLLGAR